MASSLLAAVSLVLGPAADRLPSAIVVAGSVTALSLMGRSGLGSGAAGAFEPARYRVPLLVSLMLASADLAGFAYYGLAYLEGWGRWTDNLYLAAGLGVGIYGLARMRTWGLFMLAGMHTFIAYSAFFSRMHLPGVMKSIYGVTSLAALVGLAPLLYLAGKKLFGADPPSAGERAPVEPIRVASYNMAGAAAAPPLAEIDAELEAVADDDRLRARDSAEARRARLDRDQRSLRLRA
jgi:hypothetical protein